MKLLLLAFKFIALFGCSSYIFSAQKLVIMSYNVENLFDNIDEPKKNDETYLPLSQKLNRSHMNKCLKLPNNTWKYQCLYLNWDSKTLKSKLKNLAAVINQSNNGLGPDILVLQEIENKNILLKLKALLKYKVPYVSFVEGRDSRGIDIAMLSKLPIVGKPKLVKIPFTKKQKFKTYRDILQTDFNIGNKEFIRVWGVHFPSPYHSYKLRVQALSFIQQLKQKLPANYFGVVSGDMNITSREDKKRKMFANIVNDWVIAHKQYGKNYQGTHNYKGKGWSFLDVMLIDKKFFKKNWKVPSGGYEVFSSNLQQKNKKGHPLRFDPVLGSGVSDHFPTLISLVRD